MAFDDLKHAQIARLEFLDRLFFWQGRANRSDLMDEFGISNPQAALDFKVFLERSGSNQLTYDKAAKRYVACADYQRLVGIPSSNELMGLLGQGSTGLFDSLPDLHRAQAIKVLVPLYRAMLAKRSVEIIYQSMTTDLPRSIWVLPVRFASDGLRAHLRAWSFEHQAYRDFIPARIDPAKSFQNERMGDAVPFDEDWHSWAHITLKPHGRLGPAQQAAVRTEFGFTEDTLTVRVRKALAFYTTHRWGLDHETPRLELVSVAYEPIERVEEGVADEH